MPASADLRQKLNLDTLAMATFLSRLLSQTGKCSIWPLQTGTVDIEALKNDRDQLLGGAAAYEAASENITLDPSLWGDARDAQDQRRVADPWEDLLDPMPETTRISIQRGGPSFIIRRWV